ncbi:hypothetical protein F8S13_22915 [Chloroflexia bacterium SDU3-3]|nr:hypothetical protein F8S13_22915 [Chloroflexia bacterium SDU3-3]
MHDTLLRSIARLQSLGHLVEQSNDGFLIQNARQPDIGPEKVSPELLGLYVRIAEIEAITSLARVAVAASSLSYAE